MREILEVWGYPKYRSTHKTHGGTVGREIRDRLYEYGSKVEVRVLMGPQDDAFTRRDRDLLQSEYIIANESDRMGYSLKGIP